jgi:cell division protein FtsI/penicillin-binding protein 2
VRPLEASARASSGRAKFVFYSFLAIACVVIGRFYVVQVREGPMLARRGYEQRLTTVTLAALRGTIFDRNGIPLVRSLPSQSVYATTGEVADPTREARELANVLPDTTYADIDGSLRASIPYIQVDHKITRSEANAIVKLDLPGISIVPETTGMRFDPSGRLASTVLGFTGSDEHGLAGVEYAFDGLLTGSPGTMELEGDEFGRAIRATARSHRRATGSLARAHARLVPAVGDGACVARDGRDVARRERKRDRDGPVDGRRPRARKRAGLRCRALLSLPGG